MNNIHNHGKYTYKYQQQYHNINIVYKMWIIKKLKHVMPFTINKLSVAPKKKKQLKITHTKPACN